MSEVNQVLTDVQNGVREFITEGKSTLAEYDSRISGLERKLSKSTVGTGGEDFESVGDTFVKSDSYKSFVSSRTRTSGQIGVVSFWHKTAIVNATGQNQPLVPAMRVPGIVGPGQQRFTIRDLLTVLPSSSNSIEFCRESSSTNAAAPQGAGSNPQVYENVAKAESALAFELLHQPVQTLAHWFPVSRQVLDDSTALQGYINNRGMYFLKLKEEDQLLNGDGTGANISGLITEATDYDTSDDVLNDTYMDTLSHAITQVNDSNYEADAIVVNNKDWEKIRLIKTTGTASSGEYILGDPRVPNPPSLWGLPVVPTKSITAGTFLVGAFRMGATLWDRMQSTIEVSRDYSDYFVKNMAAILFEERLALTVFQADAFRYGSYPS